MARNISVMLFNNFPNIIPERPAASPIKSPRITVPNLATTPTTIDILPPISVLLKISRPRKSVPKI